ncbi:hypothetical protein D3C76_633860 [compost metagenome]
MNSATPATPNVSQLSAVVAAKVRSNTRVDQDLSSPWSTIRLLSSWNCACSAAISVGVAAGGR